MYVSVISFNRVRELLKGWNLRGYLGYSNSRRRLWDTILTTSIKGVGMASAFWYTCTELLSNVNFGLGKYCYLGWSHIKDESDQFCSSSFELFLIAWCIWCLSPLLPCCLPWCIQEVPMLTELDESTGAFAGVAAFTTVIFFVPLLFTFMWATVVSSCYFLIIGWIHMYTTRLLKYTGSFNVLDY